MNRDRLCQVQYPEKLRQAAFRAIDRTQDQPEVQLQGIAIAMLAIAEATRVDVRKLLVSCERIMDDIDGPFSPTIRAIKEYAQHELNK